MGTIDLTDPRAKTVKTFAIGTWPQQDAKISGIELSYEQPFGKTPFGFTANVSRAKTKAGDGRPMAGASESAGNLGLYFENDTLSSRLSANYRGEYDSQRAFAIWNRQLGYTVNGVVMPATPTMAASVTTLAFKVTHNIKPNLP